MNPPWKIKRAHHIRDWYGSWEAVEQASKRDANGVYIVTLPPGLRKRIDDDPECDRPASNSWLGKFSKLARVQK